ncbi:MAG: hypothetical protein QNJ87_08980 [Gammaproteobacteria bacterium]|nr:hypothetical protein [Gammaproteobacteria bacterium]
MSFVPACSVFALLLGAASGVWAQPESSITKLMDEPVTLWDLGMHRLQHSLDEVGATEEWVAGGDSLRIRARYDREAKRIHIASRLYAFTGTADDARAKCTQLMNAIRIALGVYPPLGQPAAPTSDVVAFFLRDGSAARIRADWDSLGRALDRMVWIQVGLFRPEDLRATTECEGPLLGTRVRFGE